MALEAASCLASFLLPASAGGKRRPSITAWNLNLGRREAPICEQNLGYVYFFPAQKFPPIAAKGSVGIFYLKQALGWLDPKLIICQIINFLCFNG